MREVGVKMTGKNGGSDWEIFDIPISGRDRVGVLNSLKEKLGSKYIKKTVFVATVNPEFVMRALKDREFLEILQKTDLNVADGVGLAWAKEVAGKGFGRAFEVGIRVLGGKYSSRVVSGADLIDDLCGLGYRIGFLGGFGDRAKRTEGFFKKKYKNLKSVAIGSEFDGKTEEIIKVIAENKVEILLVAYGMERQERWIVANLGALSWVGVRLVMGVGRSFDYYSGDLTRAPGWVRKMGLEWLYSLIREPKRWRRQLELPSFVGKVVRG